MRNHVRLHVERLDVRATPSVSPIDVSDCPPTDVQSPVADIILLPPPVATGAFLPPGLAPLADGDLQDFPPPVANGAFLPPGLVPNDFHLMKTIPPDSTGVFFSPGQVKIVTG